MKNIFILSSFVLLSSANADTAVSAVYCKDMSTDKIEEITPEGDATTCVGDFIWGQKNVCFTGSAQDLADKINADFYRWPDDGYSAVQAKVVGSRVEYVGYDSMNFYSAERTIKECKSGFLD